MTRESGSARAWSVRQLAASTLVGIGLCTTVLAQVPAVDPIPPRSPMRTNAVFLEPDQTALDDLDAQIRQHPDQAESYFKRGRLHAQRAMNGVRIALEAAAADFTRALNWTPDM